MQNEKHQTYVILEGFKQNGLQIRNQRIFLHRENWVKNVVLTFFECLSFFNFTTSKTH